jgi:hypothetical protein
MPKKKEKEIGDVFDSVKRYLRPVVPKPIITDVKKEEEK